MGCCVLEAFGRGIGSRIGLPRPRPPTRGALFTLDLWPLSVGLTLLPRLRALDLPPKPFPRTQTTEHLLSSSTAQFGEVGRQLFSSLENVPFSCFSPVSMYP